MVVMELGRQAASASPPCQLARLPHSQQPLEAGERKYVAQYLVWKVVNAAGAGGKEEGSWAGQCASAASARASAAAAASVPRLESKQVSRHPHRHLIVAGAA